MLVSDSRNLVWIWSFVLLLVFATDKEVVNLTHNPCRELISL